MKPFDPSYGALRDPSNNQYRTGLEKNKRDYVSKQRPQQATPSPRGHA